MLVYTTIARFFSFVKLFQSNEIVYAPGVPAENSNSGEERKLWMLARNFFGNDLHQEVEFFSSCFTFQRLRWNDYGTRRKTTYLNLK